MEGCQRCDGNRNGLGEWKGIAEDGGTGQTCQRSIGDRCLTSVSIFSSKTILFHSSSDSLLISLGGSISASLHMVS